MKVGHSISESGVLQIRHRRSRIGPERNLIAAALSSDFFLKRHTPAVLFHEPELPTGLPDLVAVVLNAGGGAINWHRSRLKERHIRVLHYLHALRRSSRDKIAADLRMSRKQVSTVVEDLARAGLITVTAKGIRPRGLGHVFGAQAIIAIEAKIGDWSRALEQAAANHWFASHSYILIPPTKALARVTGKARELGIGVLILENGVVKVAAKARPKKLPASYGSWLLSEWALKSVRKQK